ncbi:MAG: hypothetical protein C0599_09170, partial [Salinivirgaceae bacterium]
MKKKAIYLFFSLVFSLSAVAQEEISRFISSGANDMENLMEAYLQPFGKGFGAAMNSGWYYTAKTHEAFGFDVTLNATVVTVPSADGTFKFSDYNWKLLSPGNSLTSATITGSGDGASVGLQLDDGAGTTGSIDNLYTLPAGTTVDMVPLPMMQLGVGLPKGTDVVFRFFPEIEFGDYGKMGMIGFGLRHDIKQWIPGVKKLPFDMAIQGAWSRLAATYNGIEYYPDDFVDRSTFDIVDPNLPQFNSPNFDAAVENDFYRTQDLTLTTSAWNANLIVSKKLAFFTPFVSLGYSSSDFNIGLNGKYLIPEYNLPIGDYSLADDTNGDFVITVLDEENIVKDPIDATIHYSSFNTSVGFQLKLALLSIHAAYVYQSYSMVNFGLGVT